MPLGVGDIPFVPTAVEVEPGSILVLYTDGLFGKSSATRAMPGCGASNTT